MRIIALDSLGELLDKLTILEIMGVRISEPKKLKNIRGERAELEQAALPNLILFVRDGLGCRKSSKLSGR